MKAMIRDPVGESQLKDNRPLQQQGISFLFFLFSAKRRKRQNQNSYSQNELCFKYLFPGGAEETLMIKVITETMQTMIVFGFA